jgi:hypothetical protein
LGLSSALRQSDDDPYEDKQGDTMSMKKTDLEKSLGKKVEGRMKAAGVPGRFGQGAAEAVDKREQRRRDAAAGLVAFACKLPAGLVKRLNERAATAEGGANAIVAEALEQVLDGAPQPQAAAG